MNENTEEVSESSGVKNAHNDENSQVLIADLNLRLNIMVQTILDNEGIETLANLLQYTSSDLVEKGMSIGDVAILKSKLSQRGFFLRDAGA